MEATRLTHKNSPQKRKEREEKRRQEYQRRKSERENAHDIVMSYSYRDRIQAETVYTTEFDVIVRKRISVFVGYVPECVIPFFGEVIGRSCAR